MKTCDIFIKSYQRDFKLLYYALKSITKNVTGYQNIILLIPKAEKNLFDTRDLPERTLVHYVQEYGNGYLFQQVCKMNAYKYCNSDYILFGDSDCIFTYPINLQDFVTDDKPEILYTDYNKVGQAICWKQPTENLMGCEIEFEFMRRNANIYHKSTLENICKWQPNLERIVMESKRFSEFNLLGAYAFKHESKKYNFVNTDNWSFVPAKVEQLWGWMEKDNPNPPHPYEYARALDIINKTFDLQLTEI